MLALLLTAAAFALCARPLCRFASRRIGAQPIDADVDAERLLAVMATAQGYPRDLPPATSDLFTETASFDEVAAARTSRVHPGPYVELIERLAHAATDRATYEGRAGYTTVSGRLQRATPAPTRTRMLTTALLLAAAGASVALAAGSVVMVPALFVFVFVNAVVALVDRDTFSIDLPLLAAGALVLGAITASAAALGQLSLGDVAVGLMAASVILVLFAALSFGYRVFAGVDGLGLGDAWLIAYLVGAHLAWGAPVTALPVALLVSSGVFLVATVPPALLGRRGWRDPHPFGPYLAVGFTATTLLSLVVIR